MSAIKEKSMELAIAIEGKIIKSNFADFKSTAIEQIEAINYDLKTDDEFGQAKLDVKQLHGFEKKLAASEDDILKQMDDINTLITGCRELKELSRDKRLLLNKTIKDQTAKVRKEIEDDAVASIEVGSRESYRTKIAGAMKGKRTLESLQKAATGEAYAINLHNSKASRIIDDYKKAHGDSIAPDTANLLCMDIDALTEQLERRAELAKAEIERKALEQKLAEAEQAKEEQTPIDPPKVDSIPVGNPAPAPEPTVETLIGECLHDLYGTAPAPASEPTVETPQDESQLEEINRFINTAISCFAPLKQARENLKHPANIQTAGEFAKSLGSAWSTFKNTSL